MNKAKKELLQTIEAGGILDIRQALIEWWNKWTVEVEADQLVMNVKYLESEFSDILKERLAKNCVDQITESCVEYDMASTKIKAKFTAIKRKGQ